MNPAENTYPAFSYELSYMLVDGKRKITRGGEEDRIMERPVNNYLKTPQEIEADFRGDAKPGRQTRLQDGYTDTHIPDVISGCMEENY